MDDPRRPLRVALIGYGTAGAVFHAPLITAEAGLRLTAIITSDPVRQTAARDNHPECAIHHTVDAVWSRVDEFDLAVIAAPTRHHAPLARQALALGLATVVDKPFTATVAEARDLETRAAATPLTVFHNRRYDNDFRTVKHLIDSGVLGIIHRFESRFERWRPVPKKSWKDRGDHEEAGGITYELGSHLIDQALYLFGPVTSVYAEIATRRLHARTDDDAFVALTHSCGTRTHLHLSAYAPQPGPRFRVIAENGTYEKHGIDPQENALRQGHIPSGSTWGHEAPELSGQLHNGSTTTTIPSLPGNYPEYYRQLVNHLNGHGSLPVTPQHARTVVHIIEAAYHSTHTGNVVTLTR